jgi:hypothetical protein
MQTMTSRKLDESFFRDRRIPAEPRRNLVPDEGAAFARWSDDGGRAGAAAGDEDRAIATKAPGWHVNSVRDLWHAVQAGTGESEEHEQAPTTLPTA